MEKRSLGSRKQNNSLYEKNKKLFCLCIYGNGITIRGFGSFLSDTKHKCPQIFLNLHGLKITNIII